MAWAKDALFERESEWPVFPLYATKATEKKGGFKNQLILTCLAKIALNIG